MKWNDMNATVLRWPEPDATGSGTETETQADAPVTTGEPETETPPTGEQKEPDATGSGTETGTQTDAPVTTGEPGAEAAYAIEWPEDYEPAEDFAEIATREAERAGLDKTGVGRYTAAMVAALQDYQGKQLEAQDKALKEEWGAEYESKLSSAKEFLGQLRSDGVLTAEDAAFFESPRGMRIMNALRGSVGESPAAGLQAQTANEKSWAHEAMTNPKHPDYEALHTWNHPRFKEVNRRYNKTLQM